jgi:hypothetical protein
MVGKKGVNRPKKRIPMGDGEGYWNITLEEDDHIGG